MKKIVITGAIIIALVCMVFLIFPALFAVAGTGGSMSAQHYNDGEPVGTPIFPGLGFVKPDGASVTDVTITIEWTITMVGVVDGTLVVEGKIGIYIPYVTTPTESTITSNDAVGSHPFNYILAEYLSVGSGGALTWVGTLDAHGYDDAGVRVDAAQWTQTLTITYGWDSGSITIEGSIGV